MALYRNHGENTPLLGRIKLGTTELSNGCWGIPLCSCVFHWVLEWSWHQNCTNMETRKRVKRMKKTIAITEECNQLLKELAEKNDTTESKIVKWAIEELSLIHISEPTRRS